MPVRWPSISSSELCCQVTALVFYSFRVKLYPFKEAISSFSFVPPFQEMSIREGKNLLRLKVDHLLGNKQEAPKVVLLFKNGITYIHAILYFFPGHGLYEL